MNITTKEMFLKAKMAKSLTTKPKITFREIGPFDSKKAAIALLELTDEIRAIEILEKRKKNRGKIK